MCIRDRGRPGRVVAQLTTRAKVPSCAIAIAILTRIVASPTRAPTRLKHQSLQRDEDAHGAGSIPGRTSCIPLRHLGGSPGPPRMGDTSGCRPQPHTHPDKRTAPPPTALHRWGSLPFGVVAYCSQWSK
eukprot:2358973-Prymnesium_polylepis.1